MPNWAVDKNRPYNEKHEIQPVAAATKLKDSLKKNLRLEPNKGIETNGVVYTHSIIILRFRCVYQNHDIERYLISVEKQLG